MADNNTNQERPRGFEALKQHIIDNKVDVALWASRVLTILFAFGYVLPIFGNAQNAFYKVLLANAATSALRLQQRMPRLSFSRQYLQLLLVEDSCHYLFFSTIFLYVSPFILILFPVVLFAILHAASYSLTLLDQLGQNSWWGARLMISLVELQTTNILRLAALSEILLMPLVVFFVFMGRAGLMTPFIYYHFLALRYSSRRNPYNRNMFHELRLAAESLANNPRVPPFGKKLLLSGISIVEKLAPAIAQAQH
ncbi:Krueppel homolog 2 [Contarinia nasturtii]|uniref:Krueppel homolog 2 n=1 Tax=Contarinia nasturtii TaxID=265458 RepID=UPI0012D378BE|nr:Krueppel homolog 2 [Contarinia nasturtii]XP_031624327.1 Krueppel homolog 2 [Contarinia nasturtii]XP_031624328.1 Krueppel homolog 2 [Contarinia nasturtii]XP_031624329.1 Krueppel homolog 2 [Contarinia nasturtii]XP_031624331.1 Krueppel homolog 2 [Contarinia nasturtii]XP_031624332.1 Krueppel homolog 2 [Contarinia nasturtii]